jgi:hypothetical protein
LWITTGNLQNVSFPQTVTAISFMAKCSAPKKRIKKAAEEKSPTAGMLGYDTNLFLTVASAGLLF